MKKFSDYVTNVYVYLDCSEIDTLSGPYEHYEKKFFFKRQVGHYYLTYSLKSGRVGILRSHFKEGIENYMKMIIDEKVNG